MRPFVLLACLLAAPALAQDGTPALSPIAQLDAKVRADDWQTAANSAVSILADASRTSEHAGAWRILGDASLKAGLPYAALTAYARGLGVDAQGVGPSYAQVLKLAGDLHEDIWIGGFVGANLAVPMTPEMRSEVALMGARSLFDRGEWGSALGLLPLIGNDSPLKAEGEVLRGVTLAQQQRYGDALVPLLTSYEQARVRRKDDPHYQATLAMNVARTFFASGNYGRAMEYYDKVPRSDASWLDAHFERAWAHFRVDDIAGTLALLHTHQSPFFEDLYYPEADMLRAQSLYLMCKFPSTTETIDRFEAHYKPLVAQLDKVLGTMGPHEAWQDIQNVRNGGSSKLPASMLHRLASQQRVADAMAATAAADIDLAALKGRNGAWVKPVTDALKARRDERVRAEGTRVLDYARDQRDELKDMLEGLELTRIDLLSLEADLYTRAAATGEEVAFGDKVARVRDLRKKGKHVWPFQGEYWADELGWYRVDARPDCPASLARGQ